MWSLHICIALSFLVFNVAYSQYNRDVVLDQEMSIRDEREAYNNQPDPKSKRILLLTGNKKERAMVFSKLANRPSRIIKKTNFMKSRRNQIYVTRGVPGVNYPVYHRVPRTSFRCSKQNYPGYYADIETGCQAFHICNIDGRTDSLLCPNGTIFNQHLFTCDWWYNVDCKLSPKLYDLNGAIMRQKELHSPRTTPPPSTPYPSASNQITLLQPLRRPRPPPQIPTIVDYIPQSSNIKIVTYPSSSSLRQEAPVQRTPSRTHRDPYKLLNPPSNIQIINKPTEELSTERDVEVTTIESTTTEAATTTTEEPSHVEEATVTLEQPKKVSQYNPGQNEGRYMPGDHFAYGPEPIDQSMMAETQPGSAHFYPAPRYNFRSQTWGFNDWDDARFSIDGFPTLLH